MVEADGSGQSTLVERVASPGGWEHPLVWSPAVSQIAFSDRRDGDSEIFVVDADGGNLRQITDNDAEDYVLAWS